MSTIFISIWGAANLHWRLWRQQTSCVVMRYNNQGISGTRWSTLEKCRLLHQLNSGKQMPNKIHRQPDAALQYYQASTGSLCPWHYTKPFFFFHAFGHFLYLTTSSSIVPRFCISHFLSDFSFKALIKSLGYYAALFESSATLVLSSNQLLYNHLAKYSAPAVYPRTIPPSGLSIWECARLQPCGCAASQKTKMRMHTNT